MDCITLPNIIPMAKRFHDTTMWEQKWFRKLSPKLKLMYSYMWDNADNVGVWPEDCVLASFIIGEEISIEEIKTAFNDRIKVLEDDKIWLIELCDFCYGELIEENVKNKPHQSYIKILKQHNLWKEYKKRLSSKDTPPKKTSPPPVEETPTTGKKPKLSVKDTFDIFFKYWHETAKLPESDEEAAFNRWKRLTIAERRQAYKMASKYITTVLKKSGSKEYIKKCRTYLKDKNFNDELNMTNQDDITTLGGNFFEKTTTTP